MKISPRTSQSGFALLIFLVVLMGIGGIVLAGFSQQALNQVNNSRFNHNKEVLEQAKRALLMYAYRYPEISLAGGGVARGPGRLPCPDTDNDGAPDPSFFCINVNPIVGRLPWGDADLGLFDALDASGERLWYAVSQNFANTGPVAVNSDTTGTITVFDQTGNILYGGATNGVAAVIIAPGAPLAGQDRNADPLNAANYLDTFGLFDNSVFANASNAEADGFRMGPVTNNTTLVINDQMVFITAAEVMEMAEKAVLDVYRNTLRNYDRRIDTDIAPGDYYPWLFNYAVNDYGGPYPELDEYPSDPVFFNPDAPINSERELYLGRIGRVPSIYANYFTETASQPIESNLRGNLALLYPASPATVSFNQANDKCPENPAGPDCTSGVLSFSVANNHTIDRTSTNPLTDVRFQDTVPTDDLGRLSGDVVGVDPFSEERYFWDEVPPLNDGWIQCLGGGDAITDCNNVAGVNVPGGAHDTDVQVLRVQVDITLTGTITFDLDFTPPPVVAITRAADGNGHAEISASFVGTNLNPATLPITVSYEYDDQYNGSFDIEASGTLSLADLIAGGSLTLTMRYYPELPAWIFENGWHDSVQMAYASDYLPGGVGPCTAPGTCLQINNTAIPGNDKISLLVIAGQHNWVDEGTDGLTNDVGDIFDPENDNLDDVFDVRAANGNDRIMVIEEL